MVLLARSHSTSMSVQGRVRVSLKAARVPVDHPAHPDTPNMTQTSQEQPPAVPQEAPDDGVLIFW